MGERATTWPVTMQGLRALRHRLPYFHMVNRVRLRHAAAVDANGVVRRIGPNPRGSAIALSFDDGPSPANTPAILELLERHAAHATFFVVGERVERYPELARAVVAAGHELGNHSYSHPEPQIVSAEDLVEDVGRAADAIEHLVGVRPALVRPPFGKRAKELAAAVAPAQRVVLWSVDSGDAIGLTAAQVAKEVIEYCCAGDIVLMHDGGDARPATLRALETILPALRDREFRVVGVSELLDGV